MKPIEYLSPYLPYDMQVYHIGNVYTVTGINLPTVFFKGGFFTSTEVLPILRPLSDLSKEIDHNGEKFVPLNKLYDFGDYQQFFDDIEDDQYEMNTPIRWPYELVQKLISWHFDIFNLHEKGICIYYDEI